MIKLKIDKFTGEGDILNLKEFRLSHKPLLKVDVLQDWISILENEYELAKGELKQNDITYTH